MTFESKSVFMHHGKVIEVDVFIPSFLMDYNIEDEVWVKAVDKFNDLLDARPSVTQIINDKVVDVLQLKAVSKDGDYGCLRIGTVRMEMVVKAEDLDAVADIHFCLTGQIVFKLGSNEEVEEMIIKNITYGGSESKSHRLLKETS